MIVHVLSVQVPHRMSGIRLAFGRTLDGRFVQFGADARAIEQLHYELACVSPFTGERKAPVVAHIEPWQVVKEYRDG